MPGQVQEGGQGLGKKLVPFTLQKEVRFLLFALLMLISLIESTFNGVLLPISVEFDNWFSDKKCLLWVLSKEGGCSTYPPSEVKAGSKENHFSPRVL